MFPGQGVLLRQLDAETKPKLEQSDLFSYVGGRDVPGKESDAGRAADAIGSS